ncbi:Glycoprotein membrane precursor GPI-anchored [Perilla frutescens var. hirtella]|nr:Glycoprotein membrane precursor GPI-anchored [Perilla frutescens var. hirtella]
MECFGSRLALLLLLLLLLHAFLLLSSLPAVRSDDEADLLQGMNSFRQSANAPALTKHHKAECVADEIADKLEGKSCASNTASSVQSQLVSDYPAVLSKCKVDVNTTTDGMILPVCVPRRVPTLVLTNYTQSQNARYLNDSRFTGAGVGTEDDWTVLVLTTNTPGGSFASTAHRFYAPSLLFMLSLLFLY